MKKFISTVLSIILILVIIIAALFAFTTLATRDVSDVKSVAGFTPLSVQSDSMVPIFKKGDLIIIKSVDPDTLQVGDIITFHTIIENQYALNTHKIESIDDSQGVKAFTTKGENNMFADTHIIGATDIVGKYMFKVPGVGNVMDFLSSSIGFFLVIVLPMLIFFIYQVYHLITVSISLKKATALETAQELKNDTEEQLKQKEKELEAALAEAQRLKAEMEAKKNEEQ